jgi:hypothetical protein
MSHQENNMKNFAALLFALLLAVTARAEIRSINITVFGMD